MKYLLLAFARYCRFSRYRFHHRYLDVAFGADIMPHVFGIYLVLKEFIMCEDFLFAAIANSDFHFSLHTASLFPARIFSTSLILHNSRK
jgi:hypothetical protein